MAADELKYRIAFSSVRGLTPALADILLARLGTERKFFEADEPTLYAIAQSRSKIYSRSYRDSLLEKAASEAEFVTDNRIHAIYYTDAAYPQRLLQCDDAPLMLYALGACELNNARFVSIVGTRHATAYGVDFTNRLVEELAAGTDNLVVVSGLAYGIDVAAHRAALKAGVPTIAVVAHGLNTVYPADHRATARDIIRNGGMMMSDYRSSDAIHRGNFLARNRIVAGLSDCTVVVESAEKGGALVTANIASAYGRDVFALPGRIGDRYSAGCNKLIVSNIAAMIRSAADLASAMRWPLKSAASEVQQPGLPMVMTEEETRIIDFLASHEDAMINTLSANIDMPVAQLLSMLVDLEFRGLITAYPGGRYRVVAANL